MVKPPNTPTFFDKNKAFDSEAFKDFLNRAMINPTLGWYKKRKGYQENKARSTEITNFLTSEASPLAIAELSWLDPKLFRLVWEEFIETCKAFPNKSAQELVENWANESRALRVAVLAKQYWEQELHNTPYQNHLETFTSLQTTMIMLEESLSTLPEQYIFLPLNSLIPPTINSCVERNRQGFDAIGNYLQFFVLLDIFTHVAEKGKEALKVLDPIHITPETLQSRLTAFIQKGHTLESLDLFLEYHAETNMPLLEALSVDKIYNTRCGITDKTDKKYKENKSIPVPERLNIIKEFITRYEDSSLATLSANERNTAIKEELLAKTSPIRSPLTRKTSSLIFASSPIAQNHRKELGIPSSVSSSSSEQEEDLTLIHNNTLPTGDWYKLCRDEKGEQFLSSLSTPPNSPAASEEEEQPLDRWETARGNILKQWNNPGTPDHGAEAIVGKKDDNAPLELLTCSRREKNTWKNTRLHIMDSKENSVLDATLNGLEIKNIRFSTKTLEVFVTHLDGGSWPDVFDAFTTFWNKTPQAKSIMHNGNDISKELCHALQKAIEREYPTLGNVKEQSKPHTHKAQPSF